MYTKLSTAVLLAVFLSGCVINKAVPKVKDFDVSVEAKPNQGYVKIHSLSQGWSKKYKKNGFVGFDRGESGSTSFKVKNERNADCEAGADWVITRLQLTASGNRQTEKGDRDSFDTKQPDWLKEAFPAVKDNGDIFGPVTAADGVTTLRVENANQQKGTRWIYYMLTLTSCDEDADVKQVRTDPAWKNGGRK